jgi:hypothetical protein
MAHKTIIEINKSDLFVSDVDPVTGKEHDPRPVPNGLFDPRLNDGRYIGHITFASTLFDDPAIKYLVVPPPAERPIKRRRHQHALTHTLVSIIAENERLKQLRLRRELARNDVHTLETLVGRYMFQRFQRRSRQ